MTQRLSELSSTHTRRHNEHTMSAVCTPSCWCLQQELVTQVHVKLQRVTLGPVAEQLICRAKLERKRALYTATNKTNTIPQSPSTRQQRLQS